MKNKLHVFICILPFLMAAVCLCTATDVYAKEQSIQYVDADGNWQEDGTQTDDADGGYGTDDTTADDGTAWEYYETPAVETTEVSLIAGGAPYQLMLSHAQKAVYSISAGDAAAVKLSDGNAQSVTVTPKKKGVVTLGILATGEDGTETTLSVRITVSDVSLAKKNITLYLNSKTKKSAQIALRGVDLTKAYYPKTAWDGSLQDALQYGGDCMVRVGKPAVAGAYFQNGMLYVQAAGGGSTTIRVRIYGKDMLLHVKVYHFTLNRYTVNTYCGSGKHTLAVRGTGGARVRWTTSNPNVAKVSASGNVVAKGVGTAKITAEVKGMKLVCLYSVSTKTAYRAVQRARVISKKKNIYYSQAYRMSENYYDCSSLVWRCYKPFGVRFGCSSTWAPTAAEEARWCVNTGRAVARGGVELLSRKLVPGDTLYYAGSYNGRYMNISHTALFAGYQYDELYGYYGTVLEASSSRNSVVERMYYPSGVLAGRPTR